MPAPFDAAWAQLGATGIVALFVLAILTGRLVPRSTAKALVDQANATAARWQAAAEASDKRADMFGEQLGEVVAAMRAVETLVRTSQPRVPS